MQSEVDSYVDSIPPSCQLELHLQGKEQPYERLSHHIKVTGIQGVSSITITRDVDPSKWILECIAFGSHLSLLTQKKNNFTWRRLLTDTGVILHLSSRFKHW